MPLRPDGFHDHGGGVVHAAGKVAQYLVQVLGGVEGIAQVAVVGHQVTAGDTGHATVVALPVAARSEAYTVEAIGEADDVFASLDDERLERRFHGVGAGGTSELHHVVHIAGLQDHFIKSVHEFTFGSGMHVQTMNNAVALNVFQQFFFQNRVVVAVVQGTSTRQEIDVFLAGFVVQVATLGLVEDHREIRA